MCQDMTYYYHCHTGLLFLLHLPASRSYVFSTVESAHISVPWGGARRCMRMEPWSGYVSGDKHLWQGPDRASISVYKRIFPPMINTYKIKRDAHLGFLPLLQPQLQQLTEFCLYLERQLKFLSLCSSYAQVLVQFFLLPVWPIAVTFYLASICFPFFPFKNYPKTAGLQNYYFPQIYGHLKHPVSLQEDVQTSLGFPLLFYSPHSWQTCDWLVYLSPCKVCLSHSTSCICLADLFRKAQSFVPMLSLKGCWPVLSMPLHIWDESCEFFLALSHLGRQMTYQRQSPQGLSDSSAQGCDDSPPLHLSL